MYTEGLRKDKVFHIVVMLAYFHNWKKIIQMSETLLSPQFIFSPEGELRLSTGSLIDYPASEKLESFKVAALETLEEMPGITTIEAEDELTAIVDVDACLGDSFNNTGDPKINMFLGLVRILLPGWIEDDIDRVLSVNHLNDRGLSIVVNEHFQRWLNQQGFTEEVAHDTVRSMALPFGKDYHDRAKKDFEYHKLDGVGEIVTAGSFRTTIRVNEFGLAKDGSDRFEEAQVTWRDTDMSTIGDCACLGADARERGQVYLHDGVKQLYEMGPHNIDFGRQSLSLFLGLGSMAYHAARYEGVEDIFTGAIWKD